MIACPICGRVTAVSETRQTGGGSRRRRKCTDLACSGRVTTVEVVVDGFQGANEIADGHAVLVSRRTIAQLKRIVSALGGAT